jgi:hypothetical protein
MGDDDLKVMVSSFGEQKDSDEFCDGLLGKNIDKTASSPDSAIGERKDNRNVLIRIWIRGSVTLRYGLGSLIFFIHGFQAVFRIRCFDPWIRDPGWVKKSRTGIRIRMNIPYYISES